jgi:hypothetical protein
LKITSPGINIFGLIVEAKVLQVSLDNLPRVFAKRPKNTIRAETMIKEHSDDKP